MTQHPGLQSPRDLLGKVERELARLDQEISADTFFNFAITAYHLVDWVKKDRTLPEGARRELATVRKQLSIRICRDIANGSKHFGVDYPNFLVADATCVAGYGIGGYGRGAFGAGEAVILITLADGTERDGLEIAREATQLWRAFFERHDHPAGIG